MTPEKTIGAFSRPLGKLWDSANAVSRVSSSTTGVYSSSAGRSRVSSPVPRAVSGSSCLPRGSIAVSPKMQVVNANGCGLIVGESKGFEARGDGRSSLPVNRGSIEVLFRYWLQINRLLYDVTRCSNCPLQAIKTVIKKGTPSGVPTSYEAPQRDI